MLRAGRRYLTATGLPVMVIGIQDGAVALQSLATDGRLLVPASYPLVPLTGTQEAAVAPRSRPYAPYVRPRRGRTEPKMLASIIDPLLLAGGLTMRGLVREVRRRASASCNGKNVAANIRARTYWLQKRGMRLCRDAGGRVYLRAKEMAA